MMISCCHGDQHGETNMLIFTSELSQLNALATVNFFFAFELVVVVTVGGGGGGGAVAVAAVRLQDTWEGGDNVQV